MKKIMMVVMLMANQCVLAESGWIATGETERAVHYIHPMSMQSETINNMYAKPVTSKFRAWYLTDFKVKAPGWSLISHYEYECTEKRFRRLSGIIFSEGMAKGYPVLISPGPHKWESLEDATEVDRIRWQTNCVS